MGVDGVEFNDCYSRKSSVVLDGTEVSFLGIHDLIKVKKIAGRTRDLADAEELEILLEQE